VAALMILNSDPTQPQQLGNQTPNQNEVKAYNFITGTISKIQNMKASTFGLIVGACVILIIEKKINYKAKTIKLNYGGKK
jgi:hypothetical protein